MRSGWSRRRPAAWTAIRCAGRPRFAPSRPWSSRARGVGECGYEDAADAVSSSQRWRWPEKRWGSPPPSRLIRTAAVRRMVTRPDGPRGRRTLPRPEHSADGAFCRTNPQSPTAGNVNETVPRAAVRRRVGVVDRPGQRVLRAPCLSASRYKTSCLPARRRSPRRRGKRCSIRPSGSRRRRRARHSRCRSLRP